jgi:lipopolysaccharide heptosyltransferase II
MATSGWSRAEHVLCIRLDSMGDVLMTGPAMRALRESLPGRRITLLTSPEGAAAARLLPEVDDVIEYRAPWMKTAPEDPAADAAMLTRLRTAGFDAAVIFTVYSQNPLPAALFAYLAGIPLRLAYCRENPYHLLTDWQEETEPQHHLRHEVQRQLDLVAFVGSRTEDGRLHVGIPEAARARAEALLCEAGLDRSRRWLLVHSGASAPSRRYPPESFATACRRIALETRATVVFTGSESEEPLIEDIRSAMAAPSLSLAGRLDLEELAAVVARAPLLLSNNTGPVHLAAATGTPVVVLYALTNPQHTPWQVDCRVLYHDVPCRNCYKSVCPEGHHACLRQVTPDSVVSAVEDLLLAAPALPPACP